VNVAGFLPAGVLLFAGLAILLRLLDRAVASGQIRLIAVKIVQFHEKGTIWLLKRGVLRFPGANLVTSLRSWIAGELIFLGAIILLITVKPSLPVALLLLVSGGLAGAIAVFLSFREEARKQMDAIRAVLPVASFLMSLMMEAGMGSAASLQEVVLALPRGPLSSELHEIARSRIIGISRVDAIEKSRSRVPLDDFRTFLNLVQQGERLGIALSQGLRELSSRMMESQGHRAETIAQRAAVKLLFPLVIFIFPSVFLVILSPVILNLLEMMGR
jgi:tight adherence protein C